MTEFNLTDEEKELVLSFRAERQKREQQEEKKEERNNKLEQRELDAQRSKPQMHYFAEPYLEDDEQQWRKRLLDRGEYRGY